MATVKFRLRSQTKESVSIYVYLSLGKGKMFQCKTGFTINPSDWKSNKSKNTTSKNKSLVGVPKQNNETNKTIFNKLKKLDSYVFEQLNDAQGKGVLIDKHWLDSQVKDCFKRKTKTDEGLLTNHIQYVIDNANTRKVKGRSKIGISESRVKGYKTFLELIKTYQTYIKKEVYFIGVNKPFVEKFTNWLMNTELYSKN